MNNLLNLFPDLKSALLRMIRDNELINLKYERDIYESLPIPLTVIQTNELDSIERRIIELENMHQFEN